MGTSVPIQAVADGLDGVASFRRSDGSLVWRGTLLPMLRTILLYGLLLAATAWGLQWLEFQFLMRTHAPETYVVLIAVAFLGLGIWAGARLFRRAPPATEFTANTLVQQTLRISEREFEVLRRLAAGQSNKEIARGLGVSPNTVKTHVANLFTKLEVGRRTEAIRRARELGMLH